MDAEKYVKAIVRKIKCNGRKKKEIKKQLLMDIQMRIRQGEDLEKIISQMGTEKEIADSFNENISLKEQKQYVRNKVLKIVLPMAALFGLLLVFFYWNLPKSSDLTKSKYFKKERVEMAMKETIQLLDAEDYTALQENAISQMQSVLNKEAVKQARAALSDNWGERKLFGTVYTAEVTQGREHMAVGEVTVTYENVSVTYRLTYDEDMRLAGIYIR